MAKVKQDPVLSAEPEKSEPAQPVAHSVDGRSWDPVDPANNHNSDEPTYAAPKAIPNGTKSFTDYYGEHKQSLEGAGESRPMFSSSHKE